MRTFSWITDPHFGMVSKQLKMEKAKEIQDSEFLLITGDIDAYHTFDKQLIEFQQYYQKPIYFVLGNHDSYGSIVAKAKEKARNLSNDKITYLSNYYTQISKDTILIGIDGWYDMRMGDLQNHVFINDFNRVYDFVGKPKVDFPSIAQDLADADTEILVKQIQDHAKTGVKNFHIATHVPPFIEAYLYANKQPEPRFIPLFTNYMLGQRLLDVFSNKPDLSCTVYCGHSHHIANVKILNNLRAYVGHANYKELHHEMVEIV